MTGSEEDSKPKNVELNRKVKQFSSPSLSNNNSNELQNLFTATTTSTTGKSRYQTHGIQHHQTEDKKVVHTVVVDQRLTPNSSPRSDIRSTVCNQQHRSRSSSADGDVDSSRNCPRQDKNKNLAEGSVTIEIDKSVTSSSVVIDEEHANLSLSDEELELISKDEVITLYHRLQHYIDELKRKQQDELKQAKEIESKLRTERTELTRREKVLTMKLTMRERQLVESEKQATVLKGCIVPSLGALRSTLLDPAVNLLIEKLRKDLAETKKKLEDTQNDLNAWKFTPDSNTGKRLMAKCRMLYLENEDLGRQTSSGRIAKLENDLALHKQLVTEMKQSQAESDEVLADLDEDIEGLQSAIQHLQQQLRVANENNIAARDSSPLGSWKADMNSANKGLIDLSVLCVQCRLTLNHAKIQHGISESPESADIRTQNTISDVVQVNERTTVELSKKSPGVVGGEVVENNERTSIVNGESAPYLPNYLLSVQNVVNFSNPGLAAEGTSVKQGHDVRLKCGASSDDDGFLDSHPTKKKPKLTAVKQNDTGGMKTKMQNRHSHGSFNGNGSVVDL